MKRIIMLGCNFFTVFALTAQQKNAATDSFSVLTPVEVRSIRAGDKAPFTKTNLNKQEIEKNNLGQDIPFILNQTPSVVVSSDAGNGVGYTGIRIRGTDATRVNVTLNGIPYNDAESQGTFFVNLPDFTSSVSSIQVQRGVGTSSNGTSAFGATVSLSTHEFNAKPYAEINNGYGSFNTWKHTVKAGTGLIDDHFTIDARLSQISSDGYIDRARSELRSFYLSGAYTGKKSSLRLNVFSGREKTFQAWNGVPEAKLKGTEDELLTHYYNNLGSLYFTKADSLNLFNSGRRTYNLPLYKNETDNYTQTHYQLFFNSAWNNWVFNTGAFLTRGFGYYENYKPAQEFTDYGLPSLVIDGTTIDETDLIRQKWLDTYFYGQIFSLQYKKNSNTITLGGGWSVHDGTHHGDVIWAQYGIGKDHRYYDVDALKSDLNIYAKWQYDLSAYLNLFADIQYRHVQHKMNGFEDNPDLFINRKFDFINPKAGITYSRNGWQTYFSYALGNKEPNRDDFEAGSASRVKQETLHDFEAGIEKKTSRWHAALTPYYMLYRNQLALTGMINDVGAYTRVNVPGSYRAGLEMQGGYRFADWLNAVANLSLSRNKIKKFTAFLDEYDASFEWIGQQAIEYRNTDIAFSPAVVAAASINFLPSKNIEFSLPGKYVGKQYLDNTQSAGKKLDPYYTQDARIIFSIRNKLFNETKLIAQVNNIFNKKYEPNGYTYGYVYDGTVATENFYFPMAGTNFMIGINIKL